MNDNDKSHLDHLNLGVCIKKDGVVIEQNELCKTLCGDQHEELCTTCIDKVIPSLSKQGLRVRYRIFNEDVRIVIHHEDQDKVVTFSTPTDSYLKKTILEFMHTPELTKQEKEVLKLICEGYSNNEIQACLFISKPTLKTHINHLSQKIPTLTTFRKEYLS